jgi:hypothetical protein
MECGPRKGRPAAHSAIRNVNRLYGHGVRVISQLSPRNIAVPDFGSSTAVLVCRLYIETAEEVCAETNAETGQHRGWLCIPAMVQTRP